MIVERARASDALEHALSVGNDPSASPALLDRAP
jgi:hypothetical protein